MAPSIRTLPAVFLLLFAAATCDDRSDTYEGGDVDTHCRENPGDCEGDVGGDCASTDDCSDGLCCRDKNCGGGMCTYSCGNNGDCPSSMLCEHGYCFFTCGADRNCGPGQSCEHGETVCEYE